MFSFEVVLNYNRDTRASNKFLNDGDFRILPRHCVQISSLTLDDHYTTMPLLNIKLTMLHYTNTFVRKPLYTIKGIKVVKPAK